LSKDGVPLFAGPGGIPTIFDFQGVSEVNSDLSGRLDSFVLKRVGQKSTARHLLMA
jgi:hypothetical protein